METVMPANATHITLPNGATLQGHCAPTFEPVRQAFGENFATRNEVGASVCVTHRGEKVVDLWGGFASPKTQAPWTENTVSIVFSCTKGAAALCAHLLIERGALNLHDDVAKLWPEFASNGKQGTTVANMLAHTSPVPHVREPIKAGGYCDFDYMTERLAAEPAWWEPGTRQGYHGVTYAWTVGNLVRRAASQPLGEFFRTEIAEKLNLDFHIGLPESEEHRVAGMLAPEFAEMNMASKFTQALMEPGTLSNLFMTNNGEADFNARDIHAAEICSANGITNARGLAGLYAPLANNELLKPETIARMSRVSAATHLDATLLQPLRFGLGYMVSTDNRDLGGDSGILGETAFGHVGMGGSIGFADPGAELSFGYTMNRMGAGILLNERGQSLVDAAYSALGYKTNASGAWRK
jgi:CubicO group peptidase (beta-lactamase class C family)